MLLTLNTECQLVAESFAFSIYSGTDILPSTLPGDLLKHQALVAPDDASGHIVIQHQALQ